MEGHTKIIATLVIGIAVGAVGHFVVMRGNSSPATNPHSMHGGAMQGEMAAMTAALSGKTGDAFDQAFLTEMVVHHEGAVEMAQLALQNAKHQEVKDLAGAIIVAQNKEIADMRSWQQAWYGQAQ